MRLDGAPIPPLSARRVLRRAPGAARGVGDQDRSRDSARQGRARQLRRHDRVGLGGLRGARRSQATSSWWWASAASAQTPSRVPATPARSGSSPSTRSSGSATRPRPSAPPMWRRTSSPPYALVSELTRGELADSAIITTEVASGDLIAPTMSLVRKGGAVVVTASVSLRPVRGQMSLFELTLFQKELRGALFGGGNPRADIPKLLSLYKSGQLMLDELDDPDLPARRHQRRLPGPARRAQHPGRARLRLRRCDASSRASADPGHRPVQRRELRPAELADRGPWQRRRRRRSRGGRRRAPRPGLDELAELSEQHGRVVDGCGRPTARRRRRAGRPTRGRAARRRRRRPRPGWRAQHGFDLDGQMFSPPEMTTSSSRPVDLEATRLRRGRRRRRSRTSRRASFGSVPSR